MNKLSSNLEIHQQSFQTQVNQSGTQEQRKSLIFQLNPKIKELFGSVDFDYSELFIELAVFSPFQKKDGIDSITQEKRKNFLVKNYERVLIHFFQFIFDFQQQTLNFTEKYETIPSFAQWLEEEIIFELPDRIILLNKKKNFSKKQSLKEQKINLIDASNAESPKRSYDKLEQTSQKCMIQKIQSPRKIKVIDDGLLFTDFSSKYDEVTNHTAHYTPKQNFAEKEILEQKNQTRKSPYKKQIKPQRKVLKVKQISGHKNEGLKNNRVNNRKQCYTLKPNFKEKKDLHKISNIEKQAGVKTSIRKNIYPLPSAEKKIPKDFNQQPQIIVLQSSGEEKQKKPLKSNEIEIISISECSILQEIQDLAFQSRKQKEKQQILIEQSKITIDQRLKQKELTETQILSEKVVLHNADKKQQKNGFYNFGNIQDLVQEIKISSHLQSDKNNNDYQKFYQQKQQRKLHNFRSRLSGLFRYSQKRYYIFPDMVQGYEKKQDDDIFNRKSFDYKSMSKSKSLKKERSTDKKNG